MGQINHKQQKTALHITVTGRVQGVGFRYNTRQEAGRRHIRGWVRNEPDGSVIVVCEGEKEKLESFLRWLRHGPPGAFVRDVQVRTIPYAGVYSGFHVEF